MCLLFRLIAKVLLHCADHVDDDLLRLDLEWHGDANDVLNLHLSLELALLFEIVEVIRCEDEHMYGARAEKAPQLFDKLCDAQHFLAWP